MAKKGLGRGLDALLGQPSALTTPHPNEAEGERIQQRALDQLVPSAFQPRKVFSEEALEELAASIQQHGILQPLIVRQMGGGKLELIAGERRWRAAQRAGLQEAPVIIRQAQDQEVLELALIENLQRSDLDPLEEAQAYDHLMRAFDLTQEEVAEKVGKKRATVANVIRLLALPEDLQSWVQSKRLSVGHAKVLLSLASAQEQLLVAKRVIQENLTVRQTEKLVQSLQSPSSSKRTPKQGQGKAESNGTGQAHLTDLEKRLQHRMGTRVRLHGTADRGKIEIDYFTADDFDRLLTLWGMGEKLS